MTETAVTDLGFELRFFRAFERSLHYKNWLNNAPYKLVKYLLSQHYDIFGLIEAGPRTTFQKFHVFG